jgi:hypothetical protein
MLKVFKHFVESRQKKPLHRTVHPERGIQYAREEANSAASDFYYVFGGANRDRTADLLNAIQCNRQEN